ncbi:receptor-type adenylate cyclase GRESAG 4, putative [Trypanosoma brucei brucei TREU927]|uniref:adenylate cyclase n=1 Tax=Trypanosoma brucei brucei (strain 927/4 GUTat10.1) TaxID=185431 RepID=Q57VF3_TRYB2|nr:receptor-type adenylate cyclase GRESAG 4, putative [Trypanosoma brucei brucei TREU927]AAX70416.1 receptor-type adenylate cyclase GRESAG 4, putative [Trypanosoma brucei]AAZ11180.1 receptor-type adenylate cyclase GRESAG 4, putative [Trypanosoma brucei brucei TREU927]
MRLIVLFLLSLLMVAPVVCVADNVTVKVYSLLYDPFLPDVYNNGVNAGLHASFAARQWSTASNVNVEVIHPLSYEVPPPELLQSIIEENKNEFFVVVGPLSDSDTLSVLPSLEEEDLVAFAPFTGSDAVRGWSANAYFLHVSPAAELLALLRYAVSQLHLLRIGFMYLQNVHFGDSEYELAVELMSQMGRSLCGVFTLESSFDGEADDAEFTATWELFAGTHPQGVMIFAPQVSDAMRFLMKLVTDNRTNSAYILSPTPHVTNIESAWTLAGATSGVKMFPGQVVLSGVLPLVSDDGFRATRRLRADIKAYALSGTGAVEFDPLAFHGDAAYGGQVMFGWIVGEVLAQALQCSEFLKSRMTFMDSLYNQRRYVIDDIVIGDFGGECEPLAAAYGATCYCNEGGRMIYMMILGDDYLPRPAADGLITFDACDESGVQMLAPLYTLLFSSVNDPFARSVNGAIHRGALFVSGNGHLGKSERLFIHSVPSTSGNVMSDLRKMLDTRAVTSVLGVVDDATLSTPDVVFIDPITLNPRLRHPGRNVIYLSPTLEQQLFVIAGYLASENASTLHAVMRDDATRLIETVVNRTLLSFNRSLDSVVSLDRDAPLNAALPTDGSLLLIGLTASDVGGIAAHLSANRNVRVFIPFFDVALFYDDFIRAFRGLKSAERLIFATNLPHWADHRPSSETIRRFHANRPNASDRTPLALLGFTSASFLDAVAQHIVGVDPQKVLTTIYTHSVISVDDMQYGAFADEDCSRIVGNHTDAVDGCLVNYGATHISLWPLARALNAAVPPLTKPETPSMHYHNLEEDDHPKSVLAGLVAGVLSVVVMLAVLLLVLFQLRGGARDNVNAPKELTGPVTLIFTDIESSTAQWAAHPEMMPDAVATHHRLIRALIMHYRCYEVKTVGDSFMIACHNPFNACQLACCLQRCFLQHTWGTAAFDESYRQIECQRALENEEYAPPTGYLELSVYQKLWCGLRVRVGIHTGLCDIRCDEVTKGYDYYGRTSIIAAQTESIANGGQVLLTHATYMSLKTAEREQLNVTSLGPVPLCGVPEPVVMYQLEAVPGRAFAELRIGHDSGAAGACGTASETGSLVVELSDEAQVVATSLESVLSTFAPAQRRKALMTFCERWRVSLPRNAKEVWDDAFCCDVIRVIAAKACRIAEYEPRSTSNSVTQTPGHSFALPSRVFGSVSLGSQLPLAPPRVCDAVNEAPCPDATSSSNCDNSSESYVIVVEFPEGFGENTSRNGE